MTFTKNERFAIPALASILYFSQGFPFGIVNETVNTYLSFQKVSLPQIGLIGSVGIIWTLKFLWAPVVDAVATYRMWIFTALVVLSGSIAALGATAPAGTAFLAALVVLVFASATQDIALDALAIRITPPDLLGLVNSARVAAFRVAMIVAGGGVAVLADRMGWQRAFYVAAAVPLVMLVLIAFSAPVEREVRERHENPFRGIWEWLKKPGAMWLLAVILLYRMGDNTLMAMIRPYWVERGFSAAEVGNVTTTLGMICTIAGAIAGGAFVTKFGVYRGLLVLGVIQMLSNLAYAWVAATDAGRPFLYGAAVIESFCGGLGTAAFLSFLMFICDKANAATEYAMLSALFGVGRTFAVAISGYVAEDLGFAKYYALTAALALPGLALLPLIRPVIVRRADAEGSPAEAPAS
ncbi:MAG TPA: MFS transporter [Thermoanaerobaculia bacterium]|nr:MFS transporter [Thermoanaerobaculia bacterium]